MSVVSLILYCSGGQPSISSTWFVCFNDNSYIGRTILMFIIVWKQSIRKEGNEVCNIEIVNAIMKYLAVNPRSSIHKIARALELGERIVLSHVENLCEQQRIKRSIFTLGNSIGNSIDRNCSVYYFLR